MAENFNSRKALVICDMQPDLLGSLPRRDVLLSGIKIILEIARKNKWLVVHSGLRFKSGSFRFYFVEHLKFRVGQAVCVSLFVIQNGNCTVNLC